MGLAVWAACAASIQAGPLEDYVQKADNHFSWTRKESTQTNGITVYPLELISQQWREHVWKHNLVVVRPSTIRNPDMALLYITGNSSGMKSVEMLKIVAERAGTIAAVLTHVPNQPLYDGKTEDALIAYTFDQYLKTGDETWPLLFPMAKSAVKAMDAVQQFAQKEFNQKVERFVVTGASKRGWTTWLTGAVDKRVAAIAPMVIDMLNMKTQLEWAEKVWGKQSEQIHDYTDLNLHIKLDDPPMQRLRSWVDPYSYRERYTMPKLLLLGTNDPYWVLDSLRNYWKDLPEPKLIFDTPNAGHDLAGGKEAIQTLAAFYEMIADHKKLPVLSWSFEPGHDGNVSVHFKVDQTAREVRLWTAESPDRDFRNDKWSSKPLGTQTGSTQAHSEIQPPAQGYRAYLLETELSSPSGHPYKLSSEARMTPDVK